MTQIPQTRPQLPESAAGVKASREVVGDEVGFWTGMLGDVGRELSDEGVVTVFFPKELGGKQQKREVTWNSRF